MTRNLAAKAELLIIFFMACIPLLIHLPYRVNIFLSWEGAYRISEGQLPFRDFGIPLGGMYWVIPAIFFKIFGTGLITLVKAQVFINVLAGLAFRSILKSLGLSRGIRLVSVFLFCLSYSFFNFWPWYNHTVIVYELLGLAGLLRYIRFDPAPRLNPAAFPDPMTRPEPMTRPDPAVRPDPATEEKAVKRYRWLWVVLAAFFITCSFLTKQDGGGIAVLLAGGLLAVYGWLSRKWLPLLIFMGSFVFFLLLLILPFLSHGFGYWFNHGQPPHSSRVSVFDITSELFGSSQWIKFYLFVIVLLGVIRYRSLAALKADPKGVLSMVLTIGMLGEAAILQVTSYTPPDNNIFFHSFAFAGIFALLSPLLRERLEKPGVTVVLMAGVLFWWSGVWWKYTQRLGGPLLSRPAAVSTTGENVVNKDTYMINPDTTHRPTDIPTELWVDCGLPAFRRISMPAPTADGIHRLLEMDLIRKYRQARIADPAGARLRVLNMSELTPLAAEIPFKLEKNSQLPLWYHLGVGMFNRQADTFETRVRQRYYDLVLFEYIPNLNNFYPFRVRDSLRLHYSQVDSFMAPRRGPESQGVIEVFVRPRD